MKDYLRVFNILSDEEIDWALQVAQNRTIPKDHYFIREGELSKEVAFVQSGFFRSYHHNDAGEEITYCFSFAGSFLTAYSSFITQQATAENIYAMTTASIVSIPRQEVLRLEKASHNWLRLTKTLAELEFLKMEQRVFLLKENAEYRYKDLLQHHPEYLQQIPLQHLASFLGITQRHLSRIRGLVRN